MVKKWNKKSEAGTKQLTSTMKSLENFTISKIFEALFFSLLRSRCSPLRRTLSAGTAPAFSLASLSPGAFARAVPVGVAAFAPNNK
ncbi:hypothetical protein AMD00_14870 [Viridibacillus arvi]|uniref:Uncharacterized protein n=1 Tax=Viridibacillus arvi TaxID=263475 RepID=A0A0M0LFY5_9BACL|nr:hypothetical protein AMD00_14870 [Viridibacillus arvi]